MTPGAPARVGAGRRLLRFVRARGRTLLPTSRTSLREVRARRPPAPSAFRAMGPGAVVAPPATVQNPHLVSLGARVLLHEGVDVQVAPRAAGVEVGAGTVLSRYAHIRCAQRVTIGREVSSSDHVAIIDTWGPLEGAAERVPAAAPVVIEDGAYLGFGCIIGPGVRIGAGAFVGEGAVVVDDVPPRAVVYGNPATITRSWDGQRWKGTGRP